MPVRMTLIAKKEEPIIPAVENNDTLPLGLHCGAQLTIVYFRLTTSTFAMHYFC
jgi:hypothetical protein